VVTGRNRGAPKLPPGQRPKITVTIPDTAESMPDSVSYEDIQTPLAGGVVNVGAAARNADLMQPALTILPNNAWPAQASARHVQQRSRDKVRTRGGLTLPVWKGLAHAGAAVYCLRGS
jgi:Tfp pilus assembly protein PilN